MAILPDHVHWQRHTATAQREPGQRVRKSKEPANTTILRWTIQHHRPPQARETLTTTQAQKSNHPESDIPCSSSRHVPATRNVQFCPEALLCTQRPGYTNEERAVYCVCFLVSFNQYVHDMTNRVCSKALHTQGTREQRQGQDVLNHVGRERSSRRERANVVRRENEGRRDMWSRGLRL